MLLLHPLNRICKTFWQMQYYGLSIATVAIACGLKFLLSPLIVHESPFLLFIVAILVSTYYGSRNAGLWATAIAAAVSDYFFLEPRNSFAINELGQGIQLSLFVIEGIIICLVVTRMKGAQEKVNRQRLKLSRNQAQLQQVNGSLEQRVVERTEQLSDLNNLLEEQIRTYEITERALQQSEERLNLALEASGDGIWDWNIVTGDVYLSPAWQAALGYDREPLPGHVSTWERLIHPEDKPWVMERLNAHIQDSAVPYHFNYRLLSVTGEWKWIANYGKVVARDVEGAPLRMVGIHRDIHGWKQAEQALQESEAKLRSFYENASIMMGIAEFENDDILSVSCNKGLAQFLNTPLEQLTQRWMKSFGSSSETLHLWIENFQKCEQTNQPVHFEYESMHFPARVWLSVTANCMETRSAKGRSQFAYFIEDCTERKRIEQDLLDSEARYRAIVEDQTELICRFRPDGTLTFVNNAYCKYFNKPPDELIEQVFLPLIPREDHELVTQNIATLTPTHPIISHEHRVILPSGEIRWQHWTNHALFDENGQLTTIQAVGRDITDSKTGELRIAESLQEKEVLLKEIHHRVKNNLQVISSLLNLQARALQNPDLTLQLKESQNRVRSMALVHEKLYQSESLSKINFGEYVMDLTKQLLRSYSSRSEITLNIQVDPGIFLDIDTAVPCGLIIQELFSNALKYAFSEPKSGEISILASAIAENLLCLTLRDNGAGLPPEVVSDKPKTQTLGLQLVRDLTDQLHGTLDIKSAIGTEFRIIFPQTKNDPF
jgi:PAS domain S-box-containing protein